MITKEIKTRVTKQSCSAHHNLGTRSITPHRHGDVTKKSYKEKYQNK